jgi:Holliday junction resolvase RusA-like endonuclease|tara:strand:- start:527 stop:889 length:363 start_codon:yes stop_codon:yes gene_type:complete
MKSFSIRIQRRPKVKARPRHTKSGKVFTPKGTLDEEREVAAAWQQAKGTLFKGPVEVHLAYTPAETILTVQESPHNARTLRGDLDNYVKLTLDALNGVAWDDDGQVVRIYAVKVDSLDPD